MPAFVSADAVQLEDFHSICAQQAAAEDYPHCAEVCSNIPIYQAQALRNGDRHAVLDELHRLFSQGPGVMVVRQGYADLDVV